VCRAGASLPDGWICEVVPRFSKGSDVFFYSPDGVKFRSTLEVYRHLGLDVCVAAGKTKAQKRKTQTAKDELVGACSFLLIGLDAARDGKHALILNYSATGLTTFCSWVLESTTFALKSGLRHTSGH